MRKYGDGARIWIGFLMIGYMDGFQNLPAMSSAAGFEDHSPAVVAAVLTPSHVAAPTIAGCGGF